MCSSGRLDTTSEGCRDNPGRRRDESSVCIASETLPELDSQLSRGPRGVLEYICLSLARDVLD
jgi:hypothetical protein